MLNTTMSVRISGLSLLLMSLVACGGGKSSSDSSNENTSTETNNSPQLASRPVIVERGIKSDLLSCRLDNIVLGDKTFAEMQSPTVISVTYDVNVKTLDQEILDNGGSWTSESFLFGLRSDDGTDGATTRLKEGRNVFTERYRVNSGANLTGASLLLTDGYTGYCAMKASFNINIR